MLSLKRTHRERLKTCHMCLSTLPKRSFILCFFFIGVLILCFIISSSYEDDEHFIYARNDTHLLSNTQFDCCETPETNGLHEKVLFEACLDPGQVPEYYLSIVTVSRNDNYAEDQYERLQNMIDSTFLMAEGTKTRMELLLIEWNPVPGKRNIMDTYRYRRSEYLTYRIITVPKEIHDSFNYENTKDVYEFEGKNLGIRYARGEYIVCITQDDIWSQHMYEAIRSRHWNRKTIYVQFQDIHSNDEKDLKERTSLVHLSKFATDQEIQSSCNHTTVTDTTDDTVTLTPENYLRIGHESSDFTLAHRNVWTKVGGYRETGATLWMDVEFLLTAYHSFGYTISYSNTPYNCHQIHAESYHKGQEFDNRGVQVDAIFAKKMSNSNTIQGLHWGLSHIQNELYEHGLTCSVFRGGLGR